MTEDTPNLKSNSVLQLALNLAACGSLRPPHLLRSLAAEYYVRWIV